MNKIKMIEVPQMNLMESNEMERVLGGWSCNQYTKHWFTTDDCQGYFSEGVGLCSGENNYCGKYR